MNREEIYIKTKDLIKCYNLCNPEHKITGIQVKWNAGKKKWIMTSRHPRSTGMDETIDEDTFVMEVES